MFPLFSNLVAVFHHVEFAKLYIQKLSYRIITLYIALQCQINPRGPGAKLFLAREWGGFMGRGRELQDLRSDVRSPGKVRGRALTAHMVLLFSALRMASSDTINTHFQCVQGYRALTAHGFYRFQHLGWHLLTL